MNMRLNINQYDRLQLGELHKIYCHLHISNPQNLGM